MDTLPKISIILPSLNQIRFPPERFNSILQQTWTNWELIVVDNCSDDGAWELIKSFATQDDRIHTFQFPRQGLYANWNNVYLLETLFDKILKIIFQVVY